MIRRDLPAAALPGTDQERVVIPFAGRPHGPSRPVVADNQGVIGLGAVRAQQPDHPHLQQKAHAKGAGLGRRCGCAVGPCVGTEDLDGSAVAGDAIPTTIGTRRSRWPVGDGVEDVRLVGDGTARGADDKLLILTIVTVSVISFVSQTNHKLIFFQHITTTVCLGMAAGVVW